MRIAFVLVSIVAISLIVTGVWSYHYAAGIFVEGFIFFMLEIYKNNKISNLINKLDFICGSDIELKIFKKGVEFNCDEFRTFDVWDNFYSYEKTKNYYVLYKENGSPILVKRDGFEDEMMKKEFKKYVEKNIPYSTILKRKKGL